MGAVAVETGDEMSSLLPSWRGAPSLILSLALISYILASVALNVVLRQRLQLQQQQVMAVMPNLVAPAPAPNVKVGRARTYVLRTNSNKTVT